MQVTLNGARNLNDSPVCVLLEAHIKYERTNNARSVCLHLLAIIGILVWLEAMWPAFLPRQMEEIVLTVWGILLGLAVWASLEVWIWHRKITRYIRRDQSTQRSP